MDQTTFLKMFKNSALLVIPKLDQIYTIYLTKLIFYWLLLVLFFSKCPGDPFYHLALEKKMFSSHYGTTWR